MAGEAAAAFGRIDILVNNAAIRRQVPFTEMCYGEWREIMAVILDGAFLMCRAVLPVMVAGGGGTMVNIGGVSANIGAKNRAHVSAAKAGIFGLTKARISDGHTSEIPSLMRSSYAVLRLKKKQINN